MGPRTSYTYPPPLFNLVTRRALTNHGNHLAYPLGSISGWTSLQGLGDRGSTVVSTLTDIRAQESRFVNADNLAHGAKVTQSATVGLEKLRRKLGKFCYILTGLFGYACPYVHDLKGLIDWAASRKSAFKRGRLDLSPDNVSLNNIS